MASFSPLRVCVRTQGARVWACRQVRAGTKLQPLRSFSSGGAVNLNTLTLDVPIPGLPELKPAKDLPAPKVETTVLPNGIRVTSIDNYAIASNVGAFIDTGAKFESPDLRGVNSLLEQMAFGATNKRSHSELTRDLQIVGATATTTITREQTVFNIEVLRDRLPGAVELLADVVQRNNFGEAEIKQAHQVIEHIREELGYEAQQLTMEYLHEAAYGKDTALGHPSLCPRENFDKIGPAQLKEFVKTHYNTGNLVIAAAGVDHELLVELVEKHFTELPVAEAIKKSRSHAAELYTGGEVRVGEPVQMRDVSTAHVQQKQTMTHMALGFHVGGWHEPDLVPLSVLFTLLGGGQSFSSGGPGKGLYSRLYREVLSGYQFVDCAISTAAVYDNTGIFTIYASTPPQFAETMVEILCNQFWRLASELVAQDELDRARNQLKSQLLMNLESRQLLCDDIGRQLLTYGHREDPKSLCDKIDAVTPEDMQRVCRTMIRERPSFVTYGEQKRVQTFDQIEKAFQDVNKKLGNV